MDFLKTGPLWAGMGQQGASRHAQGQFLSLSTTQSPNYGLHCTLHLKFLLFKSELPVLQNMAAFGERVFTGICKVKWEWALIVYDWCPCKKRLGPRQSQRKGNVKIQGREGSHLQAKKRDRGRNQPCWHFGLELSASRTVRKWSSAV
jgi:hypothetical protein